MAALPEPPPPPMMVPSIPPPPPHAVHSSSKRLSSVKKHHHATEHKVVAKNGKHTKVAKYSKKKSHHTKVAKATKRHAPAATKLRVAGEACACAPGRAASGTAADAPSADAYGRQHAVAGHALIATGWRTGAALAAPVPFLRPARKAVSAQLRCFRYCATKSQSTSLA